METKEIKEELTKFLQEEKSKLPVEKTEDTDVEEYIVDIEKDYKFSNKKMKQIADMCMEVLEHAGEVAMETGQPEFYKAFSDLAKVAADVNDSITGTSKVKGDALFREKKHKDSKNPSSSSDSSKNLTQNNTIYVGSPMDIIKASKEGIDLPIIDIED